jgi:formylglycine-generating enzyme required for sulfatase activity
LYRAKAEPPPEKEVTLDLGDGMKMEFTLIPAGEFMMGSHQSPEDVVKAFGLPEIFVVYLRNEHPQHRVRISKAFYLGKCEVTQEQWKAIMGTNPSFRKGAKLPVETVSWIDCQALINKLNEKFGRPGVKFSLPTEAQWEYACRGGNSTRFSFGDDKASLGEYAWYGRNSDKKTHPVGRKKPNSWGLYDMHGNVGEWCADWYDEGYYKQSPPSDPTGPPKGTSRVLRGGSFYDDLPDYFRCADRYHDHPGYRYYRYGFRVARTLSP